MSKVADALSAFIAAGSNFERAQRDADASAYDVNEMAEQLAQAGDVLESALRQMMREEVARAVRMQRAPEIQVRDDW